MKSANNATVRVEAQGTGDLILEAFGSEIKMNVGSSGAIDIQGHITWAGDGTWDIGTSSERSRHIYTDDITSTNALTVGDIKFGGGKGVIVTEPDKVWKGEDVSDGLVFMTNDWNVLGWWRKNGLLQISGTIEENVIFPSPTIGRLQ
jgi:hypothetical protein